MATKSWAEMLTQTDGRMGALRKAAPGVAKGFHETAKAATADGALSPKVKELIALGIAIADRCDGCIGYHMQAARKQGATRDEVVETIGVAVYMGGGPSMIYGAEALSAFDEMEAAEG